MSAPASRARRTPAAVSARRSGTMPRSTTSQPPRAGGGQGGVPLGIDDSPDPRGGARHDHFVAVCKHRHFGAAMYRNGWMIHRGGECEVTVGEAMTSGEQHRAALEIEPLDAH